MLIEYTKIHPRVDFFKDWFCSPFITVGANCVRPFAYSTKNPQRSNLCGFCFFGSDHQKSINFHFSSALCVSRNAGKSHSAHYGKCRKEHDVGIVAGNGNVKRIDVDEFCIKSIY